MPNHTSASSFPAPATAPANHGSSINLDSGVKWENVLFDFKIEAHFRYPGAAVMTPRKTR